jgi:hypothetical protein
MVCSVHRPEEIQHQNENTPHGSEAEHAESPVKSRRITKVTCKKNKLAPRRLDFDDKDRKGTVPLFTIGKYTGIGLQLP